MSRRDQLRQAQAAMYASQRESKVEQKTPEKMCGLCKHYKEAAFTGEGKGSCNILKLDSDISTDPPKYMLEGGDGYRCMNLMDAAKCKYYEKMEFVDKDGTECSDPVYRRSMRQMQDV